MKAIVTALFFTIFLAQLSAQDSRNAKFYISPGHISFIRIDNQMLYQLDTMQYPYRVTLPAGEHFVEVWCPKYKIYQETVTITNDTITKVVITLKEKAKEQKNYIQKSVAFRIRQAGRVAALATIISTDVRWTTKNLEKLKSLETATNITYERVLEAKEKYDNTISVTAYDTYRAEYNALNTRYKAEQEEYQSLKNKTILVNTGSVLLLGGAIYAFSKFKLEKPTKPIFQNPFLSSTSLYISPSSLGLTLNF